MLFFWLHTVSAEAQDRGYGELASYLATLDWSNLGLRESGAKVIRDLKKKMGGR